MKLSGYHKSIGDQVDLIQYPQISRYDKVYIAKVFDYTNIPNWVIPTNGWPIDNFPDTKIEYGGTGVNYDKQDFLPDKIEHHKPDYSLYNKDKGYYSNHSIGFITRFCFRQCPFCVNRNKEKAVRWSNIEEFDDPQNNYITLLDDNVLAHPNREEIIKNLQDTGKPFEFKQGIDLRLINNKIANMLKNSKYAGEFIFAFDNIKDKKQILDKLNIWRKYDQSIIKFYVLTAYDRENNYDSQFWINDIINTFERIEILMKEKCLPYIMRYKKYKESPFRGMYINFTGWCNKPQFVKKMSFREFSLMKNPKGASENYMKQFEYQFPEIADEYFDMKWSDFN